jgi:hypothetical protein
MNSRLTHFVVVAALFFWVARAIAAEKNLLPNGNFKGKNPLQGWLTSFPDEVFYKDNGPYIKMPTLADTGGRPSIMIDLAPGIAGNQGGKIESVPVPVLPGATYRVEVDCLTWDFSAKIFAEAWSSDPHPEQKRTIFRRAAADGRPAEMMCYRAQVPSPPGNSKVWTTAGREFKVPETGVIAGKDQKPEWISVKVVTYGATMAAGKSFFSNFRLFLMGKQTVDQKSTTQP